MNKKELDLRDKLASIHAESEGNNGNAEISFIAGWDAALDLIARPLLKQIELDDLKWKEISDLIVQRDARIAELEAQRDADRAAMQKAVETLEKIAKDKESFHLRDIHTDIASEAIARIEEIK